MSKWILTGTTRDGVKKEVRGCDFYTFRDVLNWMLARGLKRYCSTPLGYDPKLRLGCDLMPLDLYVRHRSGLINFFMKRILPVLEPTRNDKVLKEFSNYAELWGDDGGR